MSSSQLMTDLDDEELFSAIEQIEQSYAQDDSPQHADSFDVPLNATQQQFTAISASFSSHQPQSIISAKLFQDANVMTTQIETNSLATNTIAISQSHIATSMHDSLITECSTIATNTEPATEQDVISTGTQTETKFSEVKIPVTPPKGATSQQKNEAYLHNKFGLKSYQRGFLYFREEHVFDLDEELQYEDDEEEFSILRLKSKCWGSVVEHYSQDIILQMGNKGLIEITETTCSCPVKKTCKHCVAGLLQYLALKKDNPQTRIVAPRTLGQEYSELLARLSISERNSADESVEMEDAPVSDEQSHQQAAALAPAVPETPKVDRVAMPQQEFITVLQTSIVQQPEDVAPVASARPEQQSLAKTFFDKTPERKLLANLVVNDMVTPTRTGSALTSSPPPAPTKSTLHSPDTSRIRLTQEDFNFGEEAFVDKENDSMSDLDDSPKKNFFSSDDESTSSRKRKFTFDRLDLGRNKKRQRIL